MTRIFRTPDGRLYAPRSSAALTVASLAAMGEFDDDEFDIGDDGDDWDDDDDLDLDAYGADVYGASKKKMAAKLRKLKLAALARAAGGFVMPDQGEQQGYGLPLPFTQAFTAGQTLTFAVTPQNKIRIKELVVASPNAAQFAMTGFKVGTDDQFVAAGPLNLDMFSSQSPRRISLKGSIARLGNVISLTVQNLDTVNPQTLYGMFLGPTVR